MSLFAATADRTKAISRSQKTVCPNEDCKALNSYLSFKCINCKTKLGQLILCKGCNTTVNETAGHCGKCGAGVATKAEIANAPVLDPKSQDTGAGVVKCPHQGCNTITHPSWKFCCQCGKSLKPHGPETMGPPAHLKNLGLESEDSVDKLESESDESPPPPPEDLTTASIAGDTRKVVDLLLRGVPVNHLDEHGISSLNYACWNDRFNVVRVLSAFDADLNLRESRGYTALHAACDRSKSEALMEFLVKHGADLNGRGDMGESILHHAAAGGNLNGINFAIRHGIDVNDRDLEGATPLAYAALCDDIEPLEYLLSNGANINAKRTDGQTILHRAVQYRKTACLKFAIEKGLKVCDRDDEGHSALDIAYSTRAPQKIINFLREAFRTELSRCSFCEEAPAHIQFHPCHHQYACADCCTRWKKCKCGKAIEKKVDVITDTKGESGKVEEDDAKKFAEELAALQLEKERFNEEKTCAVCLDRPKAIVFDCGHTTCAECSLKMRLCHSCRKPIAKKIKFY